MPKGLPALGAAGRAWWADAWRTPAATQWTDPATTRTVARRAVVEDALAEELSIGLLAEARHLEHALGLTPKARKELRWRTVADDGEVVEQAGVTDELAKRRNRLEPRDTQAG